MDQGLRRLHDGDINLKIRVYDGPRLVKQSDP
jgi:hypothetical protein